MYCKNCGNQLQEGQKFCTKCGCRVESQAYNQSYNQNYNQGYNQSYNQGYDQTTYQRQRGQGNFLKARNYAFAYRVFSVLLIIASLYFIQLGRMSFNINKQAESIRQIKGAASILAPELNLIDDELIESAAGLIDKSLGIGAQEIADILIDSKEYRYAGFLAYLFSALLIALSIYSISSLGNPKNMKKVLTLNAFLFIIAGVATLLGIGSRPIWGIMGYILISVAVATILSFFLNRGINKELTYNNYYY